MNGKAPRVPSLRHEEKTKLPVVALNVIFKMHKRAMIAMPQRQVMKLHVKARVMLFGGYPQKSVVDVAVKFSPQAIEAGHIFRIGADHQCPLPYGRGTPRRGMP